MRKLVGDASMEIFMITAKNARVLMSKLWIDVKSVWRGIRAMKRESKKAKWDTKRKNERIKWHKEKWPTL